MGTITCLLMARAGKHWPLSQVSSFPSFCAQSEADPLSFLPGTFSEVSSGIWLVASSTEFRAAGCSDKASNPLEKESRVPGSRASVTLGALLANSKVFSAPTNT